MDFNSVNRRYHFPARNYIPLRANFIQIDPLALGSPMHTKGLYLYVMANPLINVDPDGRNPFDLSGRAVPIWSYGAADMVYDKTIGWYYNPYAVATRRMWSMLGPVLGAIQQDDGGGPAITPGRKTVEMEIATIMKEDQEIFYNSYMATINKWIGKSPATRYVWNVSGPQEYKNLGDFLRLTNIMNRTEYKCLRTLEMISHGAPDEITNITEQNASILKELPWCLSCSIYMTGCNTGLGKQEVGKAISKVTGCRTFGTRGNVAYWSHWLVRQGTSHLGREVGSPIIVYAKDAAGYAWPGAVDAVGDNDAYTIIR